MTDLFETLEAELHSDPVKVGDIFSGSWGYDQTNVDFFEVVAVTKSGKSARIRPVQSMLLEDDQNDDFTSTHVVPMTGPYRWKSWSVHLKDVEKGDLKRIQWSNWGSEGPRPYFTVGNYSGAPVLRRWHGAALRETAAGFGH